MHIPRAARNGFIYVLLILVFGVAVPASKGLGFFNTTLLSAYACLGTVFAGPFAANYFENRPESFKQAAGWIAKAAVFGEFLALAMLACGIATVFLRSTAAFLPDFETLGYSLLLGFAACLALAALAAWVTIEFSAKAARMVLRLVFLGLLLLFYLRAEWLPAVLGPGILISLMAAATFLMLLRNNLSKRKPDLTKDGLTEPGVTKP